MSLAGFRKQINKANQYMSEKIGSAKGSKLEDDFIELERKTDVTAKLVEDVLHKTKEYLQPNPAARARLSMQGAVQKVRGEAAAFKYPQPEGSLGETMVKSGQDLGDDSSFGQAIVETGETFHQLAEVKDALDNTVKQSFLDPLTLLETKDIKEIMHHRKKMQGRRLDFDCKKRKGNKLPIEELRIAEEKFEESKDLCLSSMMNLLENDVEQISQLSALAEAVLDYHNQCSSIMQNLVTTLKDRLSEAASKPRSERKQISRKYSDDEDNTSVGSGGGGAAAAFTTPSPPPPQSNQSQQKRYKAIYDFEPENDTELGFNEGDIISVTEIIDENWMEGTLDGKTGLFPSNYVESV
ncbi:endophilin-A3-like [Actinia tenebrosa]|uniref:Endophilin-A3-like n=1 Tax=Actinia tenebrosa TaxID=6105 RepID=A0A6P8HZC3_ACTTE|nr:endophilin-A3-like [Actinia tenebrosa]